MIPNGSITAGELPSLPALGERAPPGSVIHSCSPAALLGAGGAVTLGKLGEEGKTAGDGGRRGRRMEGGCQRSRDSHKASATRGLAQLCPTRGHRVALPGSPCSRVMQGLEITLAWLCTEQPLQSLVLSYHLLLPWPKHITHLFVHAGDTAAPLGCHIPATPAPAS